MRIYLKLCIEVCKMDEISFRNGEMNAVNLASSNHPTLKLLFVLKQEL
ncbi:hypothetical protein LINPERHAP2_LOCUS14681 [Linum perenne]